MTAPPDWTLAHADEALRRIGQEHLNAATIAQLQCPRRHKLGRVIATDAGPLYLHMHAVGRPHSTTRRELGEDYAPVGRVLTRVLLTPAFVSALDAAGLIEPLPAGCECDAGQTIPHTYILEVAAAPPRRVKGVPQVPVPAARLTPSRRAPVLPS